MTDRRVFHLVHDTARQRAAEHCMRAPEGYMVVVSEPTKRRIQEERYHAMIGDIARQCTHVGRQWDAESWKRILVDEFAEQMRAAGSPLHHDGASAVTPSIDGRRVVQLGLQTRVFYVKEAAAFIEFLFSFGADRDVMWSEPVEVHA